MYNLEIMKQLFYVKCHAYCLTKLYTRKNIISLSYMKFISTFTKYKLMIQDINGNGQTLHISI